MKFYLVKEANVPIHFIGNGDSICDGSLTPIEANIPDKDKAYRFCTDVIPFVTENEVEKEKCARVKEMLINYSLSKFQEKGKQQKNLSNIWELNIRAGWGSDDGVSMRLGLGGLFDGNILEGLRELSGDSAKLQVHLQFNGVVRGEIDISTTEMKILEEPAAHCQANNIKLSFERIKKHFDESAYEHFPMEHGCIILVRIPDYRLPQQVFKVGTSPASRALKILDEELFSDVTLVAGNGSSIKAHKTLLAAYSSVFMAMFQTDMRESRESVVEMPDMSEESVRALLKYLYYGDLTCTQENSLVAFELFGAGHKYGIVILEDEIREIFDMKPGQWYDVDVAVKLFLLARNLTPVDYTMVLKATEALNVHAPKVKTSPTYQEICKENAEAAVELLEYAFAL